MSRRHPAAAIAVVVAIASVLVATGAVFGQGDGRSEENRAVGDEPETSPVTAPVVAARTQVRGGGDLAVATYRNQAGQLCAAFGLVEDGELRDRRGRAVPVDQVANCTMRPNPVAVQVIQQGDDQATAGDERAVVVWGVATNGVDRIQVAVGDERESVAPGRDGAFIASVPPGQDQVVLTLHRSDREQEQLTLPPPPDLAELNKILKQRVPDHASHPHP